MRFHTTALGIITIIVCSVHWMESASIGKKCYHAKICIHNARERCGISNKGVVRRFLDSCDIAEYNCLYDTDFVKVEIAKCSKLPPMETEEERQKRLEEGKSTTPIADGATDDADNENVELTEMIKTGKDGLTKSTNAGDTPPEDVEVIGSTTPVVDGDDDTNQPANGSEEDNKVDS